MATVVSLEGKRKAPSLEPLLAEEGALTEAVGGRAPTEDERRNIEYGLGVANSLAEDGETPGELIRRLTQENVLLQLQHLRTHPSVAGAMAREELTISGWVYDIGKGEVRISEDGGRVFRPVTTEGGA